MQLEDEATWTTHLSSLLRHTPQLAQLTVGIDGDIVGTSQLFQSVARKTRLRRMRTLELDGFECHGSDLELFLRGLPGLESLKFSDLNILGPTTFQDVLRTVQNELQSLTFVSLHQIAQDSLRTVFATLGDVEASQPFYPSYPGQSPDFFADFLRVSGPFRHNATVEEWEGVKRKLGLLCDDVQTTHRPYRARHAMEKYGWIDRDDEWL